MQTKRKKWLPVLLALVRGLLPVAADGPCD